MSSGIRSEPPVEFEFRGTASEWFGIWIVNLGLSIVTLGIYSAWAKVRAKKYFYQNTWVAGRNFDYHATGLQILIGRIIVIVGIVVFSVASAIPALAIVGAVLLLVALPWLLVRSLRFNAVMSSWSNVRFGFQGSTGRAFLVFLLYPFLSAFTLYLAWPFADRARRRFATGGHRLGEAPFSFDAPIGRFYTAFFAAVGWFVLVALAFGASSLGSLMALGANPEDAAATGRVLVAVYAILFLGYFPAATIYGAFIRNAVFNGTTLDGRHRFSSDVRPLAVVWIAITNALAVVFTLGLMLPWAHIRLARYYAAHTRLLPGGPLDEFAGRLEARATALGDAYTDIEGIEIGLPI